MLSLSRTRILRRKVARDCALATTTHTSEDVMLVAIAILNFDIALIKGVYQAHPCLSDTRCMDMRPVIRSGYAQQLMMRTKLLLVSLVSVAQLSRYALLLRILTAPN